MNALLKEGLDALRKEELLELRKRIMAALPREWQMSLLSGREEDRIPQEEYDKFVHTQLELYKQEQTQKRQQAAQAAG